MTRGGVARAALGFGVSLLLLALLLRASNPAELLHALGAADFRFVVPAILLYFCGVAVRSVRWGLLLPRGSVSTGELFQALVVGFTFNNLLPARLGEVVRAFLLSRWRGVPYGNTFASVVVERVLDGLALAFILLVGVAFAREAPAYLLAVGILVGGGFSVGAALLGLAALRPDLIPELAGVVARFLPARLGSLLLRLAATFGHGLGLVRGWGLLAKLAGLSLLAWAFELSMFYVLLFAFRLPADPVLAMVAGTVANFATLIPSSPGYVGTFDAALARVLQDMAGLSSEVATAYTLVVHATLLLPVTLLGIAFLWRAGLSLGEVANVSSHLRPTLDRRATSAPTNPARG